MLGSGRLRGCLDCYVSGAGVHTKALYDTDKCIAVLMRQGMSVEDAIEYFDFNVIGAYVGEGTPMFATLLEKEDADDSP